MASTLFTITILLVLVAGAGLGLPALFRRTRAHNMAIGAELWADDVIEGYEGSSASAEDEVSRSAPKVTYRWGRIAIFGLGLLSLVAALVTAVLVPLTAVRWFVPPALLGLTAASLACLRFLAVRDARIRRSRAYESALDVAQVSQVILKPEPQKLEVPVATGGAQQIKPIKCRQQKPVNFAVKSLRYARTHQPEQAEQKITFARLPSGSIALEKETSALVPEEKWELRETPRPTYLDAEVKYREVTPQIQVEDDTRQSTSASLQDAAQKALVMNLDDVLSQRRAQ